ncbi:LOW QUALITY PROTEIN: hypothetical protein CVT26_011178 [Gymnopilus dilepis]|uniref:Protein kinase domain-containing protein n=1 Tax=Gymnopilus dilepis TaxID=231916 RepID=A0A409VJS1_9AGAR|nr:LOW QUALITY PROTEIN: hypothetical protein CVT26_011178 [Gymnopilus dilepis]
MSTQSNSQQERVDVPTNVSDHSTPSTDAAPVSTQDPSDPPSSIQMQIPPTSAVSVVIEAPDVDQQPVPPLLQTSTTAPPDEVRAGDIIGGYTLATIMGRGSSGEVWKAKLNGTNQFAAIKILNPKPHAQSAKSCLIATHMIKDLAQQALQYLCLPEDMSKFKGRECIVSRLYAMDLACLIETDRLFPLPINHSNAMIWQLLKGLCWITHGDIKPGNILLKDSSTVSTRHLGPDGFFRSRSSANFNISSIHQILTNSRVQEILKSPEIVICDIDEARLPRQETYHPAGTPSYRAPEMVECLYWNQKADVFAAGCVAYELLTRRLLFPEQRLTSGPMPYHHHPIEISSPAAKWARVSNPDALDFIKKATNRNAAKRPNSNVLLKHKFFGQLVHLPTN